MSETSHQHKQAQSLSSFEWVYLFFLSSFDEVLQGRQTFLLTALSTKSLTSSPQTCTLIMRYLPHVWPHNTRSSMMSQLRTDAPPSGQDTSLQSSLPPAYQPKCDFWHIQIDFWKSGRQKKNTWNPIFANAKSDLKCDSNRISTDESQSGCSGHSNQISKYL